MAVDHPLTIPTGDRPGRPRQPPLAPPSLDQAMAGLDALDEAGRSPGCPSPSALWRATWPKLIAFGLILLVWQIAVWVHWKPYILQSPATVARQLWDLLGTSSSGRPAGSPPSRRSSGTPWSSSSAASSAPPWPACGCCGPASAR